MLEMGRRQAAQSEPAAIQAISVRKHDGDAASAESMEPAEPAAPAESGGEAGERAAPWQADAGLMAAMGLPPGGGAGAERAGSEGAQGSLSLVEVPGVAKSSGDAEDVGAEAGPEAKGDGAMPVAFSLDTRTNFIEVSDLSPGGKHDTGDIAAKTTFSQPGGRAVSPFGSEFYEPKFDSTTWTFSGGVCKISTTLQINCPWGTNAGGRTNIASGTDAAITKANWQKVRDDLKPSASSPHKSPRTTYYSKSLVERHEKFHGTDDEGWTKSSGVALVQAKAKKATIQSASAAKDVEALLKSCLSTLQSENLKWYKGGGSSHDSYAGEIRAYADGKPHYAKLATDVEAHGKTLK